MRQKGFFRVILLLIFSFLSLVVVSAQNQVSIGGISGTAARGDTITFSVTPENAPCEVRTYGINLGTERSFRISADHVDGDTVVLWCGFGSGREDSRNITISGCNFSTVDCDNDGAVQPPDRCPNNAGPPDNDYCPKDGGTFTPCANNCCDIYTQDCDGDGGIGTEDNCPEQPGLKQHNYCPNNVNDSDGDGVSNDLDECPEITAETIQHKGCQPPPIAAIINGTCGDMLQEALELPVYLLEAYNTKYADDPAAFCGAVISATNSFSAVDTQTVTEISASACPELVPEYVALVHQYTGIDGDSAWEVNNKMKDTGFCDFAKPLVEQKGLPAQFPKEFAAEAIPWACDHRISEGRRQQVISLIGELGIGGDDLFTELSCEMIRSISQMAPLSESERELYRSLSQCPSYTTYSLEENIPNLAILFTALTENADLEGIRTDPNLCADPAGTIARHSSADWPPNTPSWLTQCPAGKRDIWILFARVHLPQIGGDMARIEQSLFPCDAAEDYVKTGYLPLVEIDPAAPPLEEPNIGEAVEIPPVIENVDEEDKRYLCQGGWDPSDLSGPAAVMVVERGGTQDLCVLNKGGFWLLGQTGDENEDFPAISPDGTKIAYLSQADTEGYVLKLISITDSGATNQLVWNPAIDATNRSGAALAPSAPAWHCDSKDCVLYVTLEIGGKTSIHGILNISRGTKKEFKNFEEIARASSPHNPVTDSPVGLLAYEFDSGQIRVISLNTNAGPIITEQVPAGRQCHSPRFVSSRAGWVYFACEWGSETEYYLYRSGQDAPEKLNIERSAEFDEIFGTIPRYVSVVEEGTLYITPDETSFKNLIVDPVIGFYWTLPETLNNQQANR